jgi:hypothetical protein
MTDTRVKRKKALDKKAACIYANWSAVGLGNDVVVGSRRYYATGVRLTPPKGHAEAVDFKVGNLVKVWNVERPQRIWAVWAPVNGAAVNLSIADGEGAADEPIDCPFQNVVKVADGTTPPVPKAATWLEKEKIAAAAAKAGLVPKPTSPAKSSTHKRAKPEPAAASHATEIRVDMNPGLEELSKVLEEAFARQSEFLEGHQAALLTKIEKRFESERTLFLEVIRAFSNK